VIGNRHAAHEALEVENLLAGDERIERGLFDSGRFWVARTKKGLSKS
jgi:hypothetical protein